MPRLSVRPSQPLSALAAVVGLVFIVIGVSLAIYIFPSDAHWLIKAFISLWTFVATGICLYHVANVVSARGVANEVIEVDSGARVPSTEERLQRLTDLRSKQLISEAEYQKQRSAIIDDL
jgi:hypothetical protein